MGKSQQVAAARLAIAAVAVALLAIACGCAARSIATDQADGSRPARAPNIVLIMVDDLGYGELGCYGQTKIRTPHLDRMAAEGIRLTRFYASAPVCAPTRAMLLTGLHSGHAGIRDNGEERVQPGQKWSEGQTPFPAGTRTLGTEMRERGYATGVIGKWGNGGPGSTGEPSKMGFDFSYGYLCQRQAHNFFPTHLWRDGVREDLPGNTQGNIAGQTYAQDKFIEETLAFVDRYAGRVNGTAAGPRTATGARTAAGAPAATGASAGTAEDAGIAQAARPFFLYLPYTIPHAAIQTTDADLAMYAGAFEEIPYEGGRGYLKHPTPRAGYAAMITRLDRDVGLLLDTLKARGIDRDTLVIFTSDNGPTHDVGGVDTVFFDSAGGLRGRKGSVWEGGLRVPLIARWPGTIAPDRQSAHRCASHDLYPTIVAAAGGPTPPAIDGVSFLPTLVGIGEQAVPPHLYWETPGYGGQQAVMIGDWKGVRREMGRGNMEIELFDLATDPSESRNVAPAHPAMVDRMRVIMESDRSPSEAFPMPVLDTAPKRPAALGNAMHVPVVDLSADVHRQVVVDREQGQYLGHPTTVLLEDGRTIIAVYPKGHGAGGIVMKRSADGGLTWSERLPVPASWATSKETPTLYRTIDPRNGARRLLLFSGLYPIRMAHSEDDGSTWSELAPIGAYGGIVAMSSLARLGNGDYLALFHDDGRFFRKSDEPGRPGEPPKPRKLSKIMTLYQVRSTDGGLTWSEPVAIHAGSDIHLCEGGFVRSRDGKELAILLRENRRARNSYALFSRDEGASWSQPRELPPALTGDRHTAVQAPDGRLFVSFRDMAEGSPTKGDWVGWVGTYEDIAKGREGQCRVRLMDNTNAWDCAYPGVELLPDGTIVTTTYGHWTAGEMPYIMSVRLSLAEVDGKLNKEGERAGRRDGEREPSDP